MNWITFEHIWIAGRLSQYLQIPVSESSKSPKSPLKNVRTFPKVCMYWAYSCVGHCRMLGLGIATLFSPSVPPIQPFITSTPSLTVIRSVQAIHVLPGYNVSLSCGVQSLSNPLNYTWTQNGIPLPLATNQVTYSFMVQSTAAAGLYQCNMTNLLVDKGSQNFSLPSSQVDSRSVVVQGIKFWSLFSLCWELFGHWKLASDCSVFAHTHARTHAYTHVHHHNTLVYILSIKFQQELTFVPVLNPYWIWYSVHL